jgi:hypothetical protein
MQTAAIVASVRQCFVCPVLRSRAEDSLGRLEAANSDRIVRQMAVLVESGKSCTDLFVMTRISLEANMVRRVE